MTMLGHLWLVRLWSSLLANTSSTSCCVKFWIESSWIKTKSGVPRTLNLSLFMTFILHPNVGIETDKGKTKKRNLKERNFVGHIPYLIICTPIRVINVGGTMMMIAYISYSIPMARQVQIDILTSEKSHPIEKHSQRPSNRRTCDDAITHHH